MFHQHESSKVQISALNFDKTLKTGDLFLRAQYILCFLALGVMVSAKDKPRHGLTSFTDRLRRAFHRSSPFTIVFFFFIAGTLENRVGSQGGRGAKEEAQKIRRHFSVAATCQFSSLAATRAEASHFNSPRVRVKTQSATQATPKCL